MIFKKYDKIVFAGDSVTDMDAVKPIGEGVSDNLGKGYVRVIDSMLSAWYPELNIRVVNAGFSGNSSRDLLKRFDTDVVDLNPDWVSICIGINDVWRQFDLPYITEWHVSVEEYEKNVEEMILRIKDKVKGVFIMSPYIIEPLREDAMRKRMDEYVAVCEKLSKKYGCEYIDLQLLFENYCKVQHSSYIAWDRIHPNQKGATLIAKTFLDHCGFDYNHKAF